SGLIDFVRDFGVRFLPREGSDLPLPRQLELELNPCQLRWIQAAPESEDRVAVDELWNLLKSHAGDGLSVADLTVLVDSQALGQRIVSLVGAQGAHCVNTFDEDERESRRKKLGFYMGDAKIKATTLHSFKGWETRALIVCIEQA